MAKNEIIYEWAIEEIDAYGDILDHDFCENLNKLDFHNYTPRYEETKKVELVLVRQTGNEADGELTRLWAYVDEHGRLPEYFKDGENVTKIKVPQRFHNELADYSSVTLNHW